MPIQIEATPRFEAKASSYWNLLTPIVQRHVESFIARLSEKLLVNERDLTKQLLLHLPRFSTEELGLTHVIRCEAERLACHLEARRRAYSFLQGRQSIESLRKSDVRLRECEPEVARIIHERFHYLGSYHEGIVHLGLFTQEDREFPIALASVSPMDIRRLEAQFPSPEAKKSAVIISRVFAFDRAPRNTISHLLSGVSRWVRGNLPGTESLLTFLNPNLGFSGTSFAASNWKPFAEIEPVSSYVDGNYIPYRVLLGLPELVQKATRPSLQEALPLKLLRYELGVRRGTN